MCKKMTFVILLVSVLLACNVSADTVTWDNGGTGNLWNVPENWDSDTLPASEDTVQINIPDANCVIDSSVTAECLTVYVESDGVLDMTGGSLKMDASLNIGSSSDSNGVMIMSGGLTNMGTDNQNTSGRLNIGMNGTGILIMSGGEMNIYDKTSIGRNPSGNGTLYMQDGTITFSGNSADLELGTSGTGTIYMTGGTLNVEDQIKLGESSSGTGYLYLDGGTIYASNIRPVAQVAGSALIDITEGVLILSSDRRSNVNGYIDNGWLVAYHGLGLLNVNYSDQGQTVITATSLPPELASGPSPRDHSTAERPVILSWSPGIYATSHDVYFGMDSNSVGDANNVPGLWPEFKGNQETFSFDPGHLELGRTYYWRIDEVNTTDPNSPWKGIVLSFTLADYVVIDDFESYNETPEGEPGSNLVYNTWSDGYGSETVNGSTIGYISGNSLEADIVHGGNQSVAIGYNNMIAPYSEVTVGLGDLGVDPNLKADDLRSLSFWIYGDAFNSKTEQMYMKLNGSKVNVGEPTDLRQASWLEKRVDLELFGINLGEVKELAIGFDKISSNGSTGSLLIDDIRLDQTPTLTEAMVSFSITVPSPGSRDISNFVGATSSAQNIGVDGNTRYVSFQRPAQGQTFLTGNNSAGYTLTGFWVQHVNYLNNSANGSTLYMMPTGSQLAIRVTNPAASGTDDFVLSSEVYTIKGNEPHILPDTYTDNPYGTGRWIHIMLAKSVVLAANTEYGFDLLSIVTSGYPADLFFEMAGIDDSAPDGNPYPNGTAYISGGGGRADNVCNILTGDRVFVVELRAR